MVQQHLQLEEAAEGYSKEIQHSLHTHSEKKIIRDIVE